MKDLKFIRNELNKDDRTQTKSFDYKNAQIFVYTGSMTEIPVETITVSIDLIGIMIFLLDLQETIKLFNLSKIIMD